MHRIAAKHYALQQRRALYKIKNLREAPASLFFRFMLYWGNFVGSQLHCGVIFLFFSYENYCICENFVIQCILYKYAHRR